MRTSAGGHPAERLLSPDPAREGRGERDQLPPDREPARLAQADVAAGLLVRPFGELAVELGMVYWLVLPTHVQPRDATMTVARWLVNHVEHVERAGP